MSELGASLEQRCVERLTASLKASLKRRSTTECRVAGALAVVAPHCQALLDEVATGVDVLLSRRQIERPLFKAGLHALLVARAPQADELLCRSLAFTEDPQLLVSARGVKSPRLAAPLQHIATTGRAQAAFCAELARACRGESRGARLVEVATRMKEADRLRLLDSLLVLSDPAKAMPASVWPALRILRDAERHVGRWLAWAELGGASSLDESLRVARQRAQQSSRGSLAAWQLACWALSGKKDDLPVRVPSLSQLDRLNGRSGCRGGAAFVFRLARHDAAYVRPRLEELLTRDDECIGVRARVHLARAGDESSLDWMTRTARGRGPGSVRALCIAGLFDATGKPGSAPADLSRSKALQPAVWLGLVALASRGAVGEVLCARHVSGVERGWAS